MDWTPSGMSRHDYLGIMEPAVVEAAGWLDAQGALIDPVIKSEWRQTTPRFAASAAVLLHFGRCAELMEPAFRAMSHCCAKLADARRVASESPDFWLRDLCAAFECFKGIAPPEMLEKWRASLASVRSEDTNNYADKTPGRPGVKSMHNWVVFGMSGESMRESVGIGGGGNGGGEFLWGHRWIDEYMPHQLRHFTDNGMYRDPGDPITYDITTRLQFAAALAFGYEGPMRGVLEELLRRANLAMLRFVSPGGFAPFGGRSSQFNFQEAIIAALCELEASRYKSASPALAGAFKRQAHVSARAIAPWFNAEKPFRHIKNRFPPETRHGCDAYGQYSVYSMLCASLLGLAALFADDAIAEAPAPAEIGGFTLELAPAFHKIFINKSGTYVELDTAADPHYDATGVGRILFKGYPIQLPLSAPFPSHPKYLLAEGAAAPAEPIALGPACDSGIMPEIKISADGSVVSLKWTAPAAPEIARPPLTVTVPILLHDGRLRAARHFEGATALRVEFEGKSVRYRWSAGLSLEADGTEFANRNGVYTSIRLSSPSGVVSLEIGAVQCGAGIQLDARVAKGGSSRWKQRKAL